jgi:hypothetical protein
LYNLYWSQDSKVIAKFHLLEAYRLVDKIERDTKDGQDLLEDIDAELEKRNWQH